jgi:hypothetical protein
MHETHEQHKKGGSGPSKLTLNGYESVAELQIPVKHNAAASDGYISDGDWHTRNGEDTLRNQDRDESGIVSLDAGQRCCICDGPLSASVRYGSCLICSSSRFLGVSLCRRMHEWRTS